MNTTSAAPSPAALDEWDRMIEDEDSILIDTRNFYEYDLLYRWNTLS
ncbi:MAG: hypothetical protein ACOC0D_06740 [Spirochaeta sp.]